MQQLKLILLDWGWGEIIPEDVINLQGSYFFVIFLFDWEVISFGSVASHMKPLHPRLAG